MRRPRPALAFLLAALALPACSPASDDTGGLPAAMREEAEMTAPEQQELLGRGEAIAEGACASCHAIGSTGTSPHPSAPPFRVLGQSMPIKSLGQAFSEGFTADHPDMPEWQLEQNDIDGLLAYIESVQAVAAE